MRKERKKIIAIVILSILLTLVTASAQTPKRIKQYGQLIDIEATGAGPDSQGRYEYKVAMLINGITIYLDMWMTPSEYRELKKAKGEMITIEYEWDGHGHRIYKGFKYGDHRDHHWYVYDRDLYDFDLIDPYGQITDTSADGNSHTDILRIEP